MYRSIISALVILMLIGTVGCRRLLTHLGADPVPEPPAESLDYQVAVQLYREGDYKAAGQCFNTVHQTTTDSDLRRMALYGLACSRLMTAETSEDYRQGLQLWYQWVEDASANARDETPLLMVPLLREKSFFGTIPLNGPVPGEIPESKIVPAWRLVKTQQDADNLKQQLDESDKAKKIAQKRIAALEKEIEELKSQIKALETIDQKMQKKKSAIPSAN